MASKTISQRISLEGSDDIRKKLEQLGKAGEQAFKQIQDAAKKPITDPAQIDRTKQAIDQLVQAGTKLGQQFQALTGSAQQFGAAGAKSAQQVTAALDQTGKAAEQVGAGFQQSAVKVGAVAGAVAGVFQAATSKLIGIVGQLQAAFAPSALVKGVVETSKEISDQADKLKLTTEQWIAWRKELDASGISAKDFVSSAEGLFKKLEEAKGGVARLGDVTETTTKNVGEGAVTILRFNDKLKQGAVQANQFASDLLKLGLDGSKAIRLFAAGDTEGALRAVANGLANIRDEQQKAALGTKFLGDNWKEMVKFLRGGEDGINSLTDAMAAARKAARALTADQVDAGTKLGETWKDLGLAVRSLKDNIGALFVGGAQTRADWLIKLVDKSRELVQTWSKLAEEKKAAFLEQLGETPSEILFKTLVAVSTQLAGIWRDILVPAGNALMNIFKQISGQFEGVSKSQVAAFFITATAAAIGLSLALKAIGLVLLPLTLLFSPFGAILLAAGAAAVVFWDQIAAGAEKVAALIPNSLDLIKTAIANLFAGNFAKAWDQFKQGAVAAFQTLAQAAQQAEGPVGALARGFATFLKDLPGAILLVAKMFGALALAVQPVLDGINRIFGAKLNVTDVALIAIVVQLTIGLTGLATVFGIVATGLGAVVAAIGIVNGVLTTFGLLVAGVAAALTAPVWLSAIIVSLGLLAAALVAVNWDAFKAFGVAAFEGINAAIGGVIDTIGSLITAIGNAINALLKLLGLGSEVGNPGPGRGATGSFAGGGRVGGRGTGTSDSNLAWVSRGEHIMPARAVRQPGVLAFLEALRRSGGDLHRILDGMGRFARGGLVPMPAFAGGGGGNAAHRDLGTVRLVMPDGVMVSGLADEQIVEGLRRAAAKSQIRSGGRKPSRYS